MDGVFVMIWRRPTFPHFTAVSSALTGLTSLFGMGRGGHCRYSHLKNLVSSKLCSILDELKKLKHMKGNKQTINSLCYLNINLTLQT